MSNDKLLRVVLDDCRRARALSVPRPFDRPGRLGRSLILGLAAIAVVGPEAALAQSAPDAARVDFQRRALQPRLAPLAERAPAAPAPLPAAAPGAPQSATFLLNDIVLDGAVAIDRAEIGALWRDMLATEVGVADLEDLAARIGALYRSKGYILSQAVLPAQRVEGGVVRIQVIEGFVDRVAVEGGDESAQRYVGERMEAVRADRPLRIETLERAVLLTRDTLGAGAETVLAPSGQTFGAADLTVVVDPKPYEGFVAIDNRGSRLYGGWIASAGVTSYDALSLHEQLGAVVAVAPEDASIFYLQGRSSAPLPALTGTLFDATRLELEASVTRGEPDIDRSGVVGLDSRQDEVNLTARLFTPFRRTRTSNLFGWLSATWRESTIDTAFFGEDLGEETDRLFVLEPRVAWDYADQFAGVSLIDIRLRQGLDIGGAKIGGDDPNGPDAAFTLVAATLTRIQALGEGPWSLYASMTGQYAADVLPDSERFALGGEALGRGFAPGNTTGDSGYGARLELRRRVSASEMDNLVAGAEFYGFGDWGQTFDRDEGRDADVWETLGSIGAGVRVDVTPWLTVTPEIVWQVAGEPKDRRNRDRETRAMVGLTARF